MSPVKQDRRTSNNGFRSLPLSLALLLAISSSSLIAQNGDVILKGKIHAYGPEFGNAMVYVEFNERECTSFTTGSNGRFNLTVPEGSKAVIRFYKSGYISKEVALNTDYAQDLVSLEGKRSVKFDVHLRPQPENGMQAYTAPVGNIRFLKGGLLKVKQNYQLKPIAYDDLTDK